MDNQQTTNTQGPNTLEERISTLEAHVEEIGHTLYELIETLRAVLPPPCPPICSRDAGDETQKSP